MCVCSVDPSFFFLLLSLSRGGESSTCFTTTSRFHLLAFVVDGGVAAGASALANKLNVCVTQKCTAHSRRTFSLPLCGVGGGASEEESCNVRWIEGRDCHLAFSL